MIHGEVNKIAQRVKRFEKSFLERLVIIIEIVYFFFFAFSRIPFVIRFYSRNEAQRRTTSIA